MTKPKTSSFSGNSNECVAVSFGDGDVVEIRETDEPDVIVRTTRRKWAKFILGAKAGEFDEFGDFSA